MSCIVIGAMKNKIFSFEKIINKIDNNNLEQEIVSKLKNNKLPTLDELNFIFEKYDINLDEILVEKEDEVENILSLAKNQEEKEMIEKLTVMMLHLRKHHGLNIKLNGGKNIV